MTYRLTMRDRDGTHQWNLDAWTLHVLLGALSADPDSIRELAAAARRYLPEHRLLESSQPLEAIGEVVADDGRWCLIDLVGHTAVAGRKFELPDPQGAYQPDEGDEVEGFPIVWLNTPPDWLFITDSPDWALLVCQRADLVRSRRALDTRAVLFGRPMLEFVASRVISAAGCPLVTCDRDRQEAARLQRIRAIHVSWLMTPRGDLDGRAPRELLLADRERITLDIDQRSEQWSRQGFAPDPLPASSTGYRLGLFGTTEVVLYFDLMRSLLTYAWSLYDRLPAISLPVMIERLADHRDHWLASLYDDGNAGDLTCAELIELERRRMPVTADGSHLDCGCPICQATGDGQFGIGFFMIDGHHLELEVEFAFSLTASREAWEEQQLAYRDFAAELQRRREEHAWQPESPDDALESAPGHNPR